jgi:AraC-like DNA-binding protein
MGVDPQAVLCRAGLATGLFDEPKILVTTEELFHLWQGVRDVSRDPAIGLKLGGEDHLESYDPIVIAALCTKNFDDALQRAARYKTLTCPEEIRLERLGEEYRVQFRWLLAKAAEPEVLVDVCFAWLLSIGRRGTGERLTPLRVELARPPAHRSLLERHFGCPVRFDAERNTLVLRAGDMQRPFETHHPELWAMVAPQLEAELSRRAAEESLADQVRAAIKKKLAGRRPALEDIAREMRMSPRTLQRRLREGAVSFQSVLEEARRELARHYLTHSPLELGETAYLLGYEDTNSFVRAFHGWEGRPPGDWRAAMSAERAG